MTNLEYAERAMARAEERFFAVRADTVYRADEEGRWMTDEEEKRYRIAKGDMHWHDLLNIAAGAQICTGLCSTITRDKYFADLAKRLAGGR